MKNTSYLLLLALLALAVNSAVANNLTVSDIQLSHQNTTGQSVRVLFDISWENSWRKIQLQSPIILTSGGSGYATAPKVYVGSTGSKAWTDSTSVFLADLLVSGGNYYIVTKAGMTDATTAPTHMTGTVSNGSAELMYVTVTDGGGASATATCTVSGGVVTSVAMTSTGSGYTSAPSIIFAATNGGSGATAVANVDNWWDAAWVFVKFRVGAADVTLTNASSIGTTITVASTAGLRVGMPLVKMVAGSGALYSNTVVATIMNGTQFTVNVAPQTALSGATIVASRIWEHATLAASGHSNGGGYTIDARDGVGAFIHRDTDGGSGLFSLNDIHLQWNYGSNTVLDDDVVEVRVFAIEMVYVPTGDFAAGTTGSENNRFTRTTISTSNPTTTPSGTGSKGGGGRRLSYWRVRT